jgi:osmotically-inducible protein OsmY
MNTTMTTMVHALLVISLVGVMGFKGQSSTISDPEIQIALTQRLAMDGRINPKSIQIKVENGTATLSGTVETLTEKALAENLVMSTYGVKAVNNQLMVKPAPTKDFAVEQAVKEALKSTPALQ